MPDWRQAWVVETLISSSHRRMAVEWLSRLDELFPKRLYVELQEHSAEDRELAWYWITVARQPEAARGCHS